MYVLVAGGLVLGALALGETLGWSDAELTLMRANWIGSLPATPSDPTNRVADDPKAVKFGHALFFDARLSVDGTVSCATCHQPASGFADNIPLSEGKGTNTRNAPSIIGSAYSPHQFWDGRADSLWAQALAPLEASAEHATNRMYVTGLIATQYRSSYEGLFGPMPPIANAYTTLPPKPGPFNDPEVQEAWTKLGSEFQDQVNLVFVNAGKAIAAYERQLKPGAARFDEYARTILENGDPSGLLSLNTDETAGLKLFYGRAGCVQCHSGPRFTDDQFHNTGVPANPNVNLPDTGRTQGLEVWSKSAFTCRSAFNDQPSTCNAPTPDQLVDLKVSELGAFKTPSLRNLALTAPYMHAGQFRDLRAVVQHYNRAPKALQGQSELKPLNLTDTEVGQLVAFLETLKSEPNAPLELLRAPK
jgi:cytochrome c peroxidase